MSTSDNKATVRRFIDEYQTGGDERAFAEILDPDVLDHSRHWNIVDRLGLMQQLGVIPEPEALAGPA